MDSINMYLTTYSNIIFGFFAIIITIVSWSKIAYLNRKNEILKIALKYQLGIYEDFIDIYYYIFKKKGKLDDSASKDLTVLQRKAMLYLNKKEEELFNELADAIKNNDAEKSLSMFNKFLTLSKKKIKRILYIN